MCGCTDVHMWVCRRVDVMTAYAHACANLRAATRSRFTTDKAQITRLCMCMLSFTPMRHGRKAGIGMSIPYRSERRQVRQEHPLEECSFDKPLTTLRVPPNPPYTHNRWPAALIQATEFMNTFHDKNTLQDNPGWQPLGVVRRLCSDAWGPHHTKRANAEVVKTRRNWLNTPGTRPTSPTCWSSSHRLWSNKV